MATSLPNVRPVGPPDAWLALCQSVPALCTTDGPRSIALTEARRAELAAISAAVARQHPWRPPSGPWRVLTNGAPGSCADFAVTTMARLIAQGWPVTVLRPAILFIMPPVMEPTAHMVLTVEADDGTYVLDSRRPGEVRRFTDEAFRHYHYWFRKDPDGVWWQTFELLECAGSHCAAVQ